MMGSRTRRWVTLFAFSTAAPLGAQSPWTVTITPALNPINIGYCSQVYLSLKDSTGKDSPRTPEGWRVSIADFDMSVSTDDRVSAAGQYNGASSFQVCACQGGVVGSSGTITAVYPAKTLALKSRVAGVAFEASVPFTIAAAKGSVNSTSCQALKAPSTVATIGRPVAVAGGGAAPRPIPAEPSPAPIDAPAPRGGNVQTPPKSPPRGLPLGTTRPAPALTMNRSDLKYQPMQVVMSWPAVPGATRYALFRGDGTSVSANVLPQGFTGLTFTDWVPDFRQRYFYTLEVGFADGTSVQSAPQSYLSRALENPTFLSATDNFDGTVTLVWSVSVYVGDAGHHLEGPGLPAAGLLVPHPTELTAYGYPTRQTTTVLNVPPGPSTWRVANVFRGGAFDNLTAATATITVIPAHPLPWLSKNNGAGSDAQTVAHYLPQLATGTALGESGVQAIADVSTFRSWVNGTPPRGSPLGQWANEAVYGNSVDLGVGRRADCFQEMKGPPVPGLRTVCYAAAHGIAPGAAGFNDPAVITRPGLGQRPGFILAMMIIKDPIGTQFLVFNAASTTTTKLVKSVTLDTEGPKFVPHACISCHGGKYNTTTNRVDNAHFLPLDPQLLAFVSPTVQAQQEEKIRQLNVMMMGSAPTSAVAIYIRGLYQNAQLQSGKTAKPDFIPSGWSQDQGLYRQVVRPYCVMCHLAGLSDLDFSNYGNFQNALPRIFAAVCKGHSMPHSELQYKQFWAKQVGAMNIPGLLAVTTGNPSCS